jgi:hypothetical protein
MKAEAESTTPAMELCSTEAPMSRATSLIVLLCPVLLGAGLGCLDGEAPPLTNGVSTTEHEPWFPIGPDANHALGKAAGVAAIDCDSCHGGRDTFAEPVCMGCHVEAALSAMHSEIAGYLAQDAACYGCHPRGTRDGPAGEGDHSSTFFPIGASDAHGGSAYLARVTETQTSCSACHADVVDRSVVLCAECHAADEPTPTAAHSGLSRSFEDNSAACLACHAETPISSIMHPLANHTAIEPYHHSAECRGCHQSNRDPPKDFAIDFKATSCIPCHSSACTISNPGDCD